MKSTFKDTLLGLLSKKRRLPIIIVLTISILVTVGIVVFASWNDNDSYTEKRVDIDTVQYDVLSPISEGSFTVVDKIVNRVSSFENKKIGIVVNNKRISSILSTLIQDSLKSEYSGIQISVFNCDIHEDIYDDSNKNSDKFIQWLDSVDTVISLAGDCKSSVYSSISYSTYTETAGKPTVTLCIKKLDNVVKDAKESYFMPSLRVVLMDLLEECDDTSTIEKQMSQIMSDIEEALTSEVTAEENSISLKNAESEKIAYSGTYDEVELFFYQNGWTDGLPIVMPTSEKVDEMLTCTNKDRDEILGLLKPQNNTVTVEGVAINAVMAGCRPVDFPVVLSAVESIIDKNSGHDNSIGSVASCGLFVTVNGTITNDIGLNTGESNLSSGNSSNSSIGRALNLIIKNIGGTNIFDDEGIYGNPCDYSAVLGEYDMDIEGVSDWGSLSEQYDEELIGDVVSISYITSYIYCNVDSSSPDKIVESLVSATDSVKNGSTTIVVTSSIAKNLSEAGYSLDDVRMSIYQHMKEKDSALTIEDILIAIINSENMNQVMILTCSNGLGVRVFTEIELPDVWNELITEYDYNNKKTYKYYDTAESACSNSNVVVEDTCDIYSYYLDGETDGLPVVSITSKRLDAMLEGIEYKRKDVIGSINGTDISVEMIAKNAILAGATPQYLPVIISGVKCLCNEDANVIEALTSGNNNSLIWSISGNAVDKLTINDEKGIFSNGIKSNVVIGRTLNLIVKNCADIKTKSVFGNPSTYSMVMGETSTSEFSKWNVDENMNESLITLSIGNSFVYQMMTGPRTEDYLNGITNGINNLSSKMCKVVLTTEEIGVLNDEGYTKEKLIDYIVDNCKNITKDNIDISVIDSIGITGVLLLPNNEETSKHVNEKIEFSKGYADIINKYSKYQLMIKETPTKLTVEKKPEKTYYVADAEKFDLTGIVVKADYASGVSQIIDENYVGCESVSKITSDETEVTITYKGASTTVSIDVIPRIVSSLIISDMPEKMDYSEGESFDSTGMSVTAIINSGDTLELKLDQCTITAPDKLTKDDRIIYVNYGAAATSFEVNVDECDVKDINDNLSINNFSVSIDSNDTTKINVDVEASGGNGKYSYMYYLVDKTIPNGIVNNINDKEELSKNDIIEDYSTVKKTLSWYTEQFVDAKKFTVIGDYSSESKRTLECNSSGKVYLLAAVKDEDGIVSTACNFVEIKGNTKDFTIRVKGADDVAATPYIYCWYDENKVISDPWPGNKMMADEELGDKWYKCSFSSELESYNFIISYGDQIYQTADILQRTGDTWVRINKRIISQSDAECISVFGDELNKKNNKVSINVKTLSGSSYIPYIYVWDNIQTPLIGNWPGVKAIRNYDLGENWFTVSLYTSNSYNFIINDGNTSDGEQTSDLTNNEGDVWALVNTHSLESGSGVEVYDDYKMIGKSSSVYVRQDSYSENTPCISIWYPSKGNQYALGTSGAIMEPYCEFDGIWFKYSLATSGTYRYRVEESDSDDARVSQIFSATTQESIAYMKTEEENLNVEAWELDRIE